MKVNSTYRNSATTKNQDVSVIYFSMAYMPIRLNSRIGHDASMAIRHEQGTAARPGKLRYTSTTTLTCLCLWDPLIHMISLRGHMQCHVYRHWIAVMLRGSIHQQTATHMLLDALHQPIASNRACKAFTSKDLPAVFG